jgi:hypothetical protein
MLPALRSLALDVGSDREAPAASLAGRVSLVDHKDLVSRSGVEAVRLIVVQELGWYPREPVAPDYGVDLYVECAVDGVPDGRMFAVQVKAGGSYFTEQTNTHITYRGGERHLRYWLNHSLPVLLVLYDPRRELAFWQMICPRTVQSTGKGWRVDVPVEQRLGSASAEALRSLAEGENFTRPLNALRADISWMSLIQSGGTVHLEVDEWLNKTSGRGDLRLVGTPAASGAPFTRHRISYFGAADYADVLPQLFPWATVAIDEDFYELHEQQQWDLECGAYDHETDTYLFHTEIFSEWLAKKHPLRP